MVQLKICAFDGMGSSQLCFASKQASRWCHMPPPAPIRTPTRFWVLNPKNCPPVILRPKPPNHLEKCIRYVSSTILTHVTVILDHQIIKSSCVFVWLGQLSSWLGQHGLLLLMYSCLLMSPNVLATNGQSSGHLGPSVQALHPSFTAPNPSVRHFSTWPYPCLSTVFVFHTCTPTQPRNMHVAHTLTQWLVSKLNQSRSSPHNHLSQLYTKGAHINIMSAPLFLSCVLVWVLIAQRWQGWREQITHVSLVGVPWVSCCPQSSVWTCHSTTANIYSI
jgi:hypothetical protein